LKKFNLRNRRDGFDVSALREITILKEINHENIEKILDMFYSKNNLFVLKEYIDIPLHRLIYMSVKYPTELKLSEADKKGIMIQILSGLAEIHRNGILHRDLAPSNILIKKNGIVKISDFGLSRFIASPGRPMSQGVITINYRSPEILFGAKFYSFSIDVWSAGCILAELLIETPLFLGKNDIEILKEIFNLLGLPNENNWPDYVQLPEFRLFKGIPITSIQNKFAKFNDECRDLLEKMLVLNPNNRITAEEALNHPYFKIDPLPSNKERIAEIVKKFKIFTNIQS
jgi:cyclin-dependent kinase 7